MSIKSILSFLPFANYIVSKNKKWKNNAKKYQSKVFFSLIKNGKNTLFGKDHDFSSINTYSDFKKSVSIRDYEGLSGYIEKIKNGENNILCQKTNLFL